VAPALEDLAERYLDKGFAFVFVYTREAHSGERIPHHSSLAQKLEHARLFQERWPVLREILVDELDGAVHRAYGELPNTTYVVNPVGRVVYRADWTDAHSIEWVLEVNGGGARAVEEYIDAFEQRRGRNQAEPMRRLWADMQG